MNDNTDSDTNSGGTNSGGRRRFQSGDVVVGDWVWGVRVWLVHPVIRVNRLSVTVGIHRVSGGWLTTESLAWDDIRGVIPAQPDLPADLAQALADAARRVHRGYLDAEQRGALAALLQLGGSFTLPTPVTAVLHAAVTALTRAPHDTPQDVPTVGRDRPDQDHGTTNTSDLSSGDSEEDRS